MLLLVDAGNTRVKWALIPRAQLGDPAALGKWSATGSVERAQVAQLTDAWRGQKIARALLSNVAGAPMREELERSLLGALGLAPVPLEWFASTAEAAGVRNGYRNPGQLGCDRFASAIGARALFSGQPLIVVTCGTATTIDALDADGLFIGGMILPGLGLMTMALARNTAQLPQVAESLIIEQAFADHTEAAIVSGCLAAQVGAIERAVAAQTARSGGPVRCILSGGAVPHIAPHLSLPHERIDNLVLIGLQTFAATKTPC